MVASLNNYQLKPEQFDTKPNSWKAAKNFVHWLKLFTNFLEKCQQLTEAQHVEAHNRIKVLFVYVSIDVYRHIEEYETVPGAVVKLTSVHMRSPNVSSGRHQLATRKQQSDETIDEFSSPLRF